MQNVVAAVTEGRADYTRMAQDLGLATVPSATNFVCFDMGSSEARCGHASIVAGTRGLRAHAKRPSAEPVHSRYGGPAVRASPV